ncbi:thioredoxin domain-containing protein [Candidatus Nanohaloarchaea archaeon]|nr:thioredoxin domain-containing protein [Candidatus Nanohaloarchaea archaeon]
MAEKVSLDISVKNAIAISFIAGIILGILIGGAGALTLQKSPQTLEPTSTNNPSPSPTTSDTQQDNKDGGNTVSVADLTWENDPVLGSKDAEVTLVWFSDLNCMYCRRFAQNTFPQIRENYVSQGEVRVVKKDFITMGANSVTLAKASQAAWQLVGEENPKVYWRWTDAISENQPERKRNSQTVTEDIISTTREVDGIKAEQLREKMKEISREEIQQDIQDGKQRGISGTPGFLIFRTGSDEATQMTGAQPYSVFKSEINKLLES